MGVAALQSSINLVLEKVIDFLGPFNSFIIAVIDHADDSVKDTLECVLVSKDCLFNNLYDVKESIAGCLLNLDI